MGGHTFEDDEPHGLVQLTPGEILTQSSNVGAIQIASRLGKVELDRALRRFGLGSVTDAEFPGQSPGLLLPVDQYADTGMGSVPIGYGLAVTPLQMLGVYTTLANGGSSVPPRLLDATIKANGEREEMPTVAPAPRRFGQDRGARHEDARRRRAPGNRRVRRGAPVSTSPARRVRRAKPGRTATRRASTWRRSSGTRRPRQPRIAAIVDPRQPRRRLRRPGGGAGVLRDHAGGPAQRTGRAAAAVHEPAAVGASPAQSAAAQRTSCRVPHGAELANQLSGERAAALRAGEGASEDAREEGRRTSGPTRRRRRSEWARRDAHHEPGNQHHEHHEHRGDHADDQGSASGDRYSDLDDHSSERLGEAPCCCTTSSKASTAPSQVWTWSSSGAIPAVEVRAVAHDSRQVDEGALFCCIPGTTTDGHEHAAFAERAGASRVPRRALRRRGGTAGARRVGARRDRPDRVAAARRPVARACRCSVSPAPTARRRPATCSRRSRSPRVAAPV